MIKVLFVIPEYSFGGTNKSLENLLALMDKERYDIAVYCLYEDGGDYYKKVFAPYIIKKSKLYYWLHDNIYTRKIMGFVNKITKIDHFAFLYKYEAKYMQRRYDFDVVVAYQEGKVTEFGTYFHGVKRIAWVQCDYPQLVGDVRYQTDKAYYDSYEKIVCVSDYTASSMRKFFKLPVDKVIGIHNTLDVKYIISKAEGKVPVFDSTVFNIVSIGRLHEEKQFAQIPQIVSQMKVSKPFCWYIIGSGPDEELIRSEINKYHLHDKVILLGMKDNPYPYIKNADLVVMTSRTESFSYVIAEAKLLHTPVLSSDFPVAYEVLEESYGWIVPLHNFSAWLSRIVENTNNEYDTKKYSVGNYEYSNNKMIIQIDELLHEAHCMD